MSEREEVLLIGGPYDGQTVPAHWGNTVVLTGGPLEEPECARYRPTRERGKYRFRGMDRIVGSIPIPGRSSTEEGGKA